MDIVSLLDTLLTSIFKAEEDFLKNPKEFSNLETSVKSSTEAFAAGFLGAILSELDQAIRKNRAFRSAVFVSLVKKETVTL